MLLKSTFLLICTLLKFTKANYEPCNTTDAVRINATGSSPNEGIMQICVSGYWHSVCGNSWNCPEAKVACNQLGYTGYTTYSPYCCWSNDDNSPKDNRTWHCSGDETSLTSCVHSSSEVTSSTCSYSAGISCNEHDFGPPSCTEGDVRLMNGTVSNEGRVEVCYHGIWSSLCQIDLYVATVICKQLGYTEYASLLPSHYGHSASYAHSMSCNYDVNHLNECTPYYNSYFRCYSGSYLQHCTAAIRCYSENISTACNDGSVRLVNGDIAQEGMLEICVDGIWGTVCRYGWSTIDSLVACKQMGYDFGINLHQYYQPLSYQLINGTNKPVLYSNVNCQGFEATLSHCSKLSYPHFTCFYYYYYYYGYYYTSYYYYNRAVEIRCLDECNNGDIRISGGPIETEGTVEICRNHLWGIVSDQDWGTNEARVVCRQLGFQTHDVHAVHDSYYGRPDKTVHYSYVNCTGAEDKLIQCGKTTLSLTAGKTTYKTVDAAGVSCHGPPTTDPPCIPPLSAIPSPPVCINGQIQLTGGQTPAEGILEYCYNGRWSHFCTLQPQEVTVACIELGYTLYTQAAVFTDAEFGSNNHSYSHFQNISCSSSVIDLSYCVVNEADCLPSCVPIGIRCYEPGSCEEGTVRLVDGIIEQEGRVEVCSNGVWGSICDQNWDKTDAHIICQQMGYPELEPIAFHNSYFGDGYGPIVYSNVSCGGWEQRIIDCTTTTYPSFSCSREQTAGVLCGEHCSDGDVRLVGGATKYEGTVEICFGSLWGLISETGWGDNDAQVICRQLQYDSKDAVSYVNSHFGKPNKTIQAGSITCFGDEQTLTECTMTTYELETGKALLELVDVVGVSCTPNFCLENPTVTPACSISDSIRLTGGAASNEGRLEYCYDGAWTATCSIGLSEATVACRQLGYTEYAWATIVANEASDASTNVSYWVNSTCVGTELDMTECSHKKICSSCDNNKITCYEGSNPCDEGSVRLAGGTANKNGRVEVCYNGVWGTVCESGWSLSDAIVVCKQLGLTREGVIARPVTNSSIFGQGNLPVVYSDVSCAGWETHLLECSRKHHSTFECSSSNAAGVLCTDVCSNGDVRLVGGATESEGTVEVCSRSVWGVISATGWTDTDAAVVCNQLRYPSGGAEAVGNSWIKILSSFIHLTNVQCNGTENTVFNCSADLIPEGLSNNVDNIQVAEVRCRISSTVPTNTTIGPTNTMIAPVLIIDKGSELPLAVFVGILSVVVIIGGIIITLLAVFMRRTKKSVEKESENNNDGGTSALLKDNPLFGVNDDSNY